LKYKNSREKPLIEKGEIPKTGCKICW